MPLPTDIAIFVVPFGSYLPDETGAWLMVSSWRRNSQFAIPARNKITGAYINSALAKTEAQMHGFDDAVMLDTCGNVAEATAANLIGLKGRTVITPPATADILPGITRRLILDMIKAWFPELAIEERVIGLGELYKLDELWLCGTGCNLVPVTQVGSRLIGKGEMRSYGRRLQELYNGIVRGNKVPPPPYDQSWIIRVEYPVRELELAMPTGERRV